MVKNLSCVSCAAWNVFPINSLIPGSCVLSAYSAVQCMYSNFAALLKCMCISTDKYCFSFPTYLSTIRLHTLMAAKSWLITASAHLSYDPNSLLIGMDLTMDWILEEFSFTIPFQSSTGLAQKNFVELTWKETIVCKFRYSVVPEISD